MSRIKSWHDWYQDKATLANLGICLVMVVLGLSHKSWVTAWPWFMASIAWFSLYANERMLSELRRVYDSDQSLIRGLLEELARLENIKSKTKEAKWIDTTNQNFQ